MVTLDIAMSVWRLRQIMADKRITNQQLADKINAITGKKVHTVTISRWKNVDVMPKINGTELDAIIKALGVSRNELLGEE
jgi:DNA-binding Xre family transcriptional regulator